MKLEEYSSLEDKQKSFQAYQVINNTKELENFLSCPKKGALFRGLSEAKYKLYTSSQRFWLQKDVQDIYGFSYLEFVERMIANFQKNRFFSGYLKSLHVPVTEFNILCCIQHYGAPSPLLDFTYNRDVALYFATEGISYSGFHVDVKGLDNYLSVYSLDGQAVLKYYDFLKKVAKDVAQKTKGAVVKSKITSLEQLFSIDLFLNNLEEGQYLLVSPQKTKRKPIQFGDKDFDSNVYIGNMNLIAQNGALLLNASDEKPIKESLLSCVDIHKSLLPVILDAIKDMKKNQLFPNMEELAQQSLNNTLRLQ